jgi:hypothetical protein
LEALALLGMNADDIRCAYCGDKSTEWDHLHPIITDQRPTGHITEIANLVPACGKCNQSKGKSKWHDWILSSARLSPKTRGVANLAERIEKLELYAMWKPATRIEFDLIVTPEVWALHNSNWRRILDLLHESQKLAKEIRQTIENAPRYTSPATGQTIYGKSAPEIDANNQEEIFLEPEEILGGINQILVPNKAVTSKR